MTKKDYYKILNVPKNATLEVIKWSYNELSLKYHPDYSEGDTSKQFQEVQEAYEILSDKWKRYRYDQGFHSYDSNSSNDHTSNSKWRWEYVTDIVEQFRGFSNFEWNNDFFSAKFTTHSENSFSLNDFFSNFFGSNQSSSNFYQSNNATDWRKIDINSKSFKRANNIQRNDIIIEEYVDFLDFYNERIISIKYNRKDIIGNKIVNVKIEQKIKCKIEYKNNMLIMIPNKGHYDPYYKKYSNLFLSIKIKKHPFLIVKGLHLFIDTYMNLIEYMIGCTRLIPTLKGVLKVTIPSMMNNKQIVLWNWGINSSGEVGNLVINIHVIDNIKLSKSCKEKLKSILDKYYDELIPMQQKKLDRFIHESLDNKNDYEV